MLIRFKCAGSVLCKQQLATPGENRKFPRRVSGQAQPSHRVEEELEGALFNQHNASSSFSLDLNPTDLSGDTIEMIMQAEEKHINPALVELGPSSYSRDDGPQGYNQPPWLVEIHYENISYVVMVSLFLAISQTSHSPLDLYLCALCQLFSALYDRRVPPSIPAPPARLGVMSAKWRLFWCVLCLMEALLRGCPRPWKHGFVLSRKRLARGFPCSSSAARGSGTADLLQPRLAVTPLLLSFPPPCSSSSSGTETGDTPRPPLPPSQAEARLRVEVQVLRSIRHIFSSLDCINSISYRKSSLSSQ
ncbi:hypothetical protein RRG08_007976 [Elysia crispata]|uniref:Uncharacterized protein n=1 Tax=Elysia crispata TaxID=231223 RepID=A0AAE1DJY4_9GAST|nr:hypothetical protein RRG08_007976 [Elysia crispata]